MHPGISLILSSDESVLRLAGNSFAPNPRPPTTMQILSKHSIFLWRGIMQTVVANDVQTIHPGGTVYHFKIHLACQESGDREFTKKD